MKYDFSLNYTGNPPTDLLIFINTNTSNMFVYGFVLLFFIVLTFIFIKKTDDVSLSMVRGGFASVVLSLFFYYWGLSMGYSLFSGSILIGEILIVSAGAGMLYYGRNETNG